MASMAVAAIEVRTDLLRQAPETHATHWHAIDAVALSGIIAIDAVAPYAFTHPDTTAEAAEKIERLLTAYRSSLPFDEAERGWIVKVASDFPTDEAVEELRLGEDVLVSRGVRRAVVGDELLGRWVSWRRGIDEFRGQGTVVSACRALKSVGDSALPTWRELQWFHWPPSCVGQESLHS